MPRFSLRYLPLAVALVATASFARLAWTDPGLGSLLGLLAFSALSLLGLRDLLQPKHAILRNYPIAAHLRFLFEKIRPEMRQYFFEDDKDGLPFPRDKRAIVYQCAKGVLDKRPFGTQYDVYANTNGCTIRSLRGPPLAIPFALASADRTASSPIPLRSSTFRP